MLGFLTQLLHRLAVFVDKRRGSLVVFASVLLFLATVSGVIALRPPLLTPVIDAVGGWFQGVLAKPLSALRGDPGQEAWVELELEVARLRELERENLRLRGMLGYEASRADSLVPARVVALDLDPVRGLAWIDKGRNHGIVAGQAVVAAGGFVGLIEQVQSSRSRLRLLINRDAPLGVRDTRSRTVGVVEWNPSSASLNLNFIPRQADVAVGDTLITSGLGGRVRPGIPVGRVGKVQVVDHEILMSVQVQPFASFHRLEEVFVLEALRDSVESTP